MDAPPPSESLSRPGFGKPHVVILGAGASLAAFSDGDDAGRRFPVMQNLVETLGLREILVGVKGWTPDCNFEEFFSDLVESPHDAQVVTQLEARIHAYFSAMRCPKERTLYDDLLLSLREKDVIATFNWDPMLYASCYKNRNAVKLPHVLYLHGNVAIGYCMDHRRMGSVRMPCGVCGKPLVATPLLYPVKRKNYTADPFIAEQWSILKDALRSAYMLTIFGYGAPAADVDAVQMLTDGWGLSSKRALEEVELIDIADEETLRQRWRPIIHSHHYRISTTFYDSWIARHPRRSCEDMFSMLMDCLPVPANPIPRELDVDGAWRWIQPLLDAEAAAVTRTQNH